MAGEFQYHPRQFDRKWANFLASGETHSETNDYSKLVGKVILVSPSLPSPSGFAKILWSLIRPPFYNITKLTQTIGEVVVVSVEEPTAHLELVTVTGPDVKTVKWSDAKENLQEVLSLPVVCSSR